METTIKETPKLISIARNLAKIKTAQFYFEWGNERKDNVSTGRYNSRGEYKSCGQATKEQVIEWKLPYNCPFN